MKNEKTKLIIWAVVALVIGVIIGMIITNATTGNAKLVSRNDNLKYKNTIFISEFGNSDNINAHWQCYCNGAAQTDGVCDFTSNQPENIGYYCSVLCPCSGTQTYQEIN